MQQPVEVQVDEHEQIVERVAAIDVAKASGMVCLRVPHERIPGRRVTTVWPVAATTAALVELGDHLRCERVQRVVLESTSDYWRPFYYLLEAAGLTVWLVNAAQVRNVPGRPKTDKLDAVWLAKLAERSMLSPSLVPAEPMRRVRDLARARYDLVEDRTRVKQRIEKLLEDALIKLSSVTSTMNLLSVRDMLEALIAGERDPRRLADLARGRLKTKHSALVAALDGRFDAHHAELARLLLDQIDGLTAQINTLTGRIGALIAAIDEHHTGGGQGGPPSTPDAPAPTLGEGNPVQPSDTLTEWLPTIERLDEITGIGPSSAQVILAEIGWDMSRFPTPAHLVSWAKLCPRTIQSGPVIRGGKTGKGNPYLKGVLGEAAAVAARTDTFLGERYRRIVKRRGRLKALVAVARSLLVIVWHLLADPTARFHDLGADYYTNRVVTERKLRNHLAQLAALGYRVTLEPAA